MGLRKGISSAPTAQVKGATDIPDYVAPVSSSPEAKMVMKSKPTPSSDFKSAEPKPAPAELSSPEPADTGEETVSGKMVMKTKPTSLPPASRPSKMVMRQPKLQVSKMSMATSLPSFNQIAPPAPPASEPRYLMNEEGKTNIGQKVKLKPIEEVVSPANIPSKGETSGGMEWKGQYGMTSPRGKRGNEFHAGYDYGVPKDTPLSAAYPGKVVFAGPQQGYGNTVVYEVAPKYQILLGHMDAVKVKPGQTVQPGDTFGLSGNTGRSRGAGGGYHVHREFRIGGKSVDQKTFFDGYNKYLKGQGGEGVKLAGVDKPKPGGNL